MATPTNRVPVRVARGYLSTLQSSIADLYEGELVYAVDEQALFAVEAEALVPVAGTSVLSVNGQTGNVVLNVSDLDDINFDSLSDGDMLVYSGGEWVNTPATSGGTVFSIDVEGVDGIESTGGPVTNSGVIQVGLTDTGAIAGEYTYPTVTVDEKGRVTQIASNPIPGAELNFDDLQDVDAPSPGIGDGIVWNGSAWVNSPDVGGSDVEFLGDLTDVDATPAQDGQALIWEQSSGTWRPGSVGGGGGAGGDLGDLGDVDLSFLPEGAIISWNSTTQLWESKVPFIRSLSDSQDVIYASSNFDFGSMKTGQTLLWSEEYETWYVAYPEEFGRERVLIKTTTTSSESPLIGGDAPLAAADWSLLGFIEAEIDTTSGTSSYGKLRTSFSVDAAISRTTLYGKVLSNMPEMYSREIIYSQQSIAFGRLLEGLYEEVPPGDWTDFDFQANKLNNARVEVSLFADDAKRFNMQVTAAGFLPSYQDADGVEWSIYRKELVSNNNSTWNWAQEVWISGRDGSIIVKQGQPSWAFSWSSYDTSLSASSHGVVVSTNGSAPPNYGDGRWQDLPTSGSYVASVINQPTPVETGATELNELTDVSVDNATDGQVLTYRSADDTWYAADDNDAENLSDLNDVSSAAPATGEALVWSGSEWAPTTVGGGSSDVDSISDLSDVDTESSAPAVGQLLAWNGSNWVPADAPVTGATSLDDLSDVDTTTPAPQDTQVLSYSQSDDEWQAANPRATAGAPTQTNYPGLPGEMRYSSTHFYICIAPNTWKQVELAAIGGGSDPGEIGDIADGGDFNDGSAGTIDTILDGGNFTTGGSSDQQDVIMDGGLFTPGSDSTPGPDDAVDGGDFNDGTSDGSEFVMDGGNFTTGEAGSEDVVIDGGVITDDTEIPANGGNFTTGEGGTVDEVVDGGNFSEGAIDNTPANGGNFTTGENGELEEVVDGGNFSAASGNGGNFSTGEAGDSDEVIDGGNFTAG